MTETPIRVPRFDFSAAVTQVFNLPGGKGYLLRVIGFGTLLLAAAFVLLGLPIVKAYAAMFTLITEVETTGLSEAEELDAVMKVLTPFFASMGLFFLLYFFQFGLYISIETALYRNIIHGEDKGVFPLRFGGDECKVLLTRIVVALIIYAVFFAVYFGGAIVGVALGALGAALESAVVFVIIGLVIACLIIALFGVMIYATIRLAPSAAFSVRDEDFTPVGSWTVMGNYFWPTFGALLVVGIAGYIGLMIVSFAAFGILIAASGIPAVLVSMDTETVPDFSPLIEAVTSGGFLASAFVLLIVLTGLGLLYMSAIWSIWGYIAKLTDGRHITENYI